MLTNNLSQSVLLNPVVEEAADELLIVSGYATSAMAFWHLNSLVNEGRRNLRIKVLVGMCNRDGMSRSNHRGFQDLVTTFPNNFECSYVINNAPVHAKTYAWLRNGQPIRAFLGSANYTQTAFGVRQREAMVSCDAQMAKEYFERIARDTIYCTHNDVAQLIQLYSEQNLRRAIVQAHENGEEEALEQLNELEGPQADIVGLNHVTLSLLGRSGQVGLRSGLNWGQRPEERRELNQAYIRVPAAVYSTDFFPPPTVHFTVLTDDNRVLICTRAQERGKAIQTPHNNSLIGLYFRNRLGLQAGELVTLEHLVAYGRTSVDFYKIDDETYFMDFSV